MCLPLPFRRFERTGKRSDIFLASKFGMVMVNGRPAGVDGRPEYCKEQIDISLKRLGGRECFPHHA